MSEINIPKVRMIRIQLIKRLASDSYPENRGKKMDQNIRVNEPREKGESAIDAFSDGRRDRKQGVFPVRAHKEDFIGSIDEPGAVQAAAGQE